MFSDLENNGEGKFCALEVIWGSSGSFSSLARWPGVFQIEGEVELAGVWTVGRGMAPGAPAMVSFSVSEWGRGARRRLTTSTGRGGAGCTAAAEGG